MKKEDKVSRLKERKRAREKRQRFRRRERIRREKVRIAAGGNLPPEYLAELVLELRRAELPEHLMLGLKAVERGAVPARYFAPELRWPQTEMADRELVSDIRELVSGAPVDELLALRGEVRGVVEVNHGAPDVVSDVSGPWAWLRKIFARVLRRGNERG